MCYDVWTHQLSLYFQVCIISVSISDSPYAFYPEKFIVFDSLVFHMIADCKKCHTLSTFLGKETKFLLKKIKV